MPVGPDNTARIEPVDSDQAGTPAFEEDDPATVAPLCEAAEFAELVQELVAAEAPRLFAVVQEIGTRVDVRVAAWGLAFEDYTEVVGVDRRPRQVRADLKSPELAARLFSRRPHITAHVEWVKPTRSVLDAES